jgi:hypothetical protein
MAIKTDIITNNTASTAPAPVIPGSRPLSNSKREKYCRLRALMTPRVAAYKQSGWKVATDAVAGVNAARLESNREIIDRIAYLSRPGEELIRAKRQRLEEKLWQLHEADIGDLFEHTEIPRKNRNGEPILDKLGQPVMRKAWRVKDLNEIPPELRQAVESITLDSDGNLTTAKLVSKIQANQELRKLLGIDRQPQQPSQSDLTKLTDAELVAELSRQANELGVQIDLSYKFGED